MIHLKVKLQTLTSSPISAGLTNLTALDSTFIAQFDD